MPAMYSLTCFLAGFSALLDGDIRDGGLFSAAASKKKISNYIGIVLGLTL